jgi:MFS family permease
MTEHRTGTRPGAAVTFTGAALGVDMFLYGCIAPLLPGLPTVDGSPLTAGVLFAVYAAALLAATPFIGVWVDRRGPRTPMLAGLLGLAAATVLFAWAVDVEGGSGLALLLAARAVQGIAAASSWTEGLALIAVTHAPEQRSKAMGLALSAVGMGVLLGPAVGGPLSDLWGPRAPILVVAALAAGDAVARAVLIRETLPPQVRAPYRAILRGPRVALLIALTGLGATAIVFPEPVRPLHLDELGPGTTAIGLVFAGAALGGSLAAPVAGLLTDRAGATRIASVGALVAAGFFLRSGVRRLQPGLHRRSHGRADHGRGRGEGVRRTRDHLVRLRSRDRHRACPGDPAGSAGDQHGQVPRPDYIGFRHGRVVPQVVAEPTVDRAQHDVSAEPFGESAAALRRPVIPRPGRTLTPAPADATAAESTCSSALSTKNRCGLVTPNSSRRVSSAARRSPPHSRRWRAG